MAYDRGAGANADRSVSRDEGDICMPRAKTNWSKPLVEAAFRVLRAEGPDALSARRISEEASCSVQPLYASFGDMDGMHAALREYCEEWTHEFMRERLYLSPNSFEAAGLAHIALAREEPNVFLYVFLSPRAHVDGLADFYRLAVIPEAEAHLLASTDLSIREARELYTQMSIFTHGMAVGIATRSTTFSDEEIRRQVGEAFRAFYGWMRPWTEGEADWGTGAGREGADHGAGTDAAGAAEQGEGDATA